jgi:hypothetical protein
LVSIWSKDLTAMIQTKAFIGYAGETFIFWRSLLKVKAPAHPWRAH